LRRRPYSWPRDCCGIRVSDGFAVAYNLCDAIHFVFFDRDPVYLIVFNRNTDYFCYADIDGLARIESIAVTVNVARASRTWVGSRRPPKFIFKYCCFTFIAAVCKRKLRTRK
jgi:hypothetical protein